MSKDEIRVSIENNTLVISGEKKKDTHDKDKNFVREERFWGRFSRAIALPADVEADKVKASYKDGTLELVIPKKESAKPQQIQIDVK